MNEKFQNRYRIPSNRLRGWDYSGNGHYFVTIVTAGRENLFGDIQNGEMILNEMGQIVYDEFFKSFEIRNELFLGAFVLMPNHLHTIVMLDKPHCKIVETSDGNEEMHGNKIAETHGRASLRVFVGKFHHSVANSHYTHVLSCQAFPYTMSPYQ